MMMIAAVRHGLADALASSVTGVTVHRYVPPTVHPPAVVVRAPAVIARTGSLRGGTVAEWVITVYVGTGPGIEHAQAQLDDLLDTLPAELERHATPVWRQAAVTSITNWRQEEVGDTDTGVVTLLAADLIVTVTTTTGVTP